MNRVITNLAKNLIRTFLKFNDLVSKIFCYFFLESSNLWKNDPKAFLFSLKNPTNNPRKLPQIDNSSSYSVDDYVYFGPTFGRKDLCIRSHANTGYSRGRLGYTYTVPSGKRGDLFLTGDYFFTASEIETFYETTVSVN